MSELTHNNRIDELEVSMLENFPKVDCQLVHKFTPGLYSRTIIMPEGTLITSRVHITRHQFVISAGVAMVKVNDGEWDELRAPYVGITEPGTRRVLYVPETCVWTTFHPVDVIPEGESEEEILNAVNKVDELILSQDENELLGVSVKNNILQNQIDK